MHGCGRDSVREGHEVVETATAAVGPMNRVCFPRLRLIQLQIKILHVLDQRRIFVARVLERQERIDGRIVQKPLDVPDDLQAGLGVQPAPVLRFDVSLSLDIFSLELPSLAVRGKCLVVVAEAERQPRPDPAVEPGLRGRFAGLVGHDGFEPSFGQGNLAFGRNAALGKMRRQ